MLQMLWSKTATSVSPEHWKSTTNGNHPSSFPFVAGARPPHGRIEHGVEVPVHEARTRRALPTKAHMSCTVCADSGLGHGAAEAAWTRLRVQDDSARAGDKDKGRGNLDL